VKSSATVATVAPRIFGISCLDHAVARLDDELRHEHQRLHAGAGDADFVHADRPADLRDVRRERLAQLRQAEVVRVEHFARGDGVHAGLADELRRGLVGLAHPEGEHVLSANALVVQLADLRGREGPDRRAGNGKRKWGQSNLPLMRKSAETSIL
jgi:hypothetical protein